MTVCPFDQPSETCFTSQQGNFSTVDIRAIQQATTQPTVSSKKPFWMGVFFCCFFVTSINCPTPVHFHIYHSGYRFHLHIPRPHSCEIELLTLSPRLTLRAPCSRLSLLSALSALSRSRRLACPCRGNGAIGRFWRCQE